MKKLRDITYDNLEEYFKTSYEIAQMESILINSDSILSLNDLIFMLRYYSFSKVIRNIKFVNLAKSKSFKTLKDMLEYFRKESTKSKIKSAICFKFASTFYGQSKNVMFGHTYLRFITDKQKKQDLEKLIEVDEESMEILDSIGYESSVIDFYGIYDKDTDKLYVEYKLATTLLDFKESKIKMFDNCSDKEVYGGREINGIVSNKLDLIAVEVTLIKDCKLKRLNVKSKNLSCLETKNSKIKEIYIEEIKQEIILFLNNTGTNKLIINISDEQIEKVGKTENKYDSIIAEIRAPYVEDKEKELTIKELIIRVSDKAYKEIKSAQYIMDNLIKSDAKIEKITLENKSL